MTAPATDAPAVFDHPRTRTMAGWRGRKAVMASRGETSGPRVEEADQGLTWWRHRGYLVNDMGMSEADAEALLEFLREDPETDADTDQAVG